jgi:surface polysaccharide O-acyltransferase-like enzyme
MNKKTLKSIGAVLAGAFVGVVLSIGTDMALRAAGVLPPLSEPAGDIPLLLATVYRTAFGVLGAYITARLAPDRPMMHALVLGAVGLAATIVGTVITWNKGPAFGPHWYPLALIALAMPQSWAGGRLREIQLHAHGSLV